MKNWNVSMLVLMLVFMACSEDNDPIQDETPQGHKMLLIGNSFFKPYAEQLDILAANTGLENHSSTLITRGGDNGRPINFWNDFNEQVHLDIKATLDQGNVDFFGMTAGKLEENPTDGFREWIAYALQSNPNITIFLSIPPFDFPKDWDQLAQDNGASSVQELYSYFVNDIIHKNLVDELRNEFPSTNIFTIPTGWATINLAQMNLDGLLMDDISMFGPKATSIFTDNKGHQGQINIETGGLMWLNSLYGTDLSNNTYETGFNTDLHEIATHIMNEHDSDYKL